MRPRLLLALLVALSLAAGGCGGDSDGASSSTPSAATAPEATSDRGAQDDAAKENSEAHRGAEASIEDFGSEAEGAEREAILTAFSGYLGAIAAKDYATACAGLSQSIHRYLEQLVVKSLARKGCPAILPKLLSPTASQIARQQAEGEVTKVRVEDDRAFVVFEAPGAELYQLTMAGEGGGWKATTLGAAVLVPEL